MLCPWPPAPPSLLLAGPSAPQHFNLLKICHGGIFHSFSFPLPPVLSLFLKQKKGCATSLSRTFLTLALRCGLFQKSTWFHVDNYSSAHVNKICDRS